LPSSRAEFNEDGVSDLAMLTQSVATASILLTEPTETVIATVNDIAPVGAGAHNVEASYSGDGSYSPEVSGTIPPTAARRQLYSRPQQGLIPLH
jgi:hypothetical protein